MIRAPSVLIAAAALLAASAAHAKDDPICTDRPAKANAVCTVPAGRVQLETSLLGWSRFDLAGTRTDTFSAGSSLFKYGLTSRSDLQLAFTPYVRVRSRVAGHAVTTSGAGDVTVRYKHRLTADDAALRAALIPFVKLPTARRGIGNRKLEAGVALPLGFALAGPVSALLGPELDLVADADGSGRHLAVVNVVNLSSPLAPRLTVAAELWSNFNFDSAGTVRQVSADAALAYAVHDNFQLDAGLNAGLTRNTPDLELYFGLSLRL